MTMQVGMTIVDVLNRAARRYLAPEGYDAFVFQLEASGALDRYDGGAYWDRVQAILDGFFTASQRAAICEQLIADGRLRERPEFHGFLIRALAERRVQGLVQVVQLAQRARQLGWDARPA